MPTTRARIEGIGHTGPGFTPSRCRQKVWAIRTCSRVAIFGFRARIRHSGNPLVRSNHVERSVVGDVVAERTKGRHDLIVPRYAVATHDERWSLGFEEAARTFQHVDLGALNVNFHEGH